MKKFKQTFSLIIFLPVLSFFKKNERQERVALFFSFAKIEVEIKTYLFFFKKIAIKAIIFYNFLKKPYWANQLTLFESAIPCNGRV